MEEIIKRIMDIVVAIISLIVLAPLFIIIMILIKIDDGGPVFYIQERVGRGFQTFKLLKFRTMVVEGDKKGLLITRHDDQRITRVGKILRKYKIDELPQLINIIKGDMSIVGPRPEMKKYVDLFKEEYKSILKVRPGLTDYATIEFRNEEEILGKFYDPEQAYINVILPNKIELSRKYVNEAGLITDILIIAKTIKAILFG